MKVQAFTKQNGKMVIQTIEAENEEAACKQLFDIERESKNAVEIIAIRFSGNKIVTWNSTMAHYCWGEGQISFLQFILNCIEMDKF